MNDTVNKIVNMVRDMEEKYGDVPIEERRKIIEEYNIFDGDAILAIMLATLELFEVGR